MDQGARAKAEQYVLGYLENLKLLEILYSDTGNPLFIWDAIAVLNHLRSLPRVGIQVPELPLLPEWGLPYIINAAIDITKLANGELDSGAGSPVDRVPHMLGLKPKQGTNSFVEYRAKRRDLDISDRFESLKRAGNTSAQADEMLRQEFGEKEHSVIQKRKTSGKRLRDRLNVSGSETKTE